MTDAKDMYEEGIGFSKVKFDITTESFFDHLNVFNVFNLTRDFFISKSL